MDALDSDPSGASFMAALLKELVKSTGVVRSGGLSSLFGRIASGATF